MAGIGFELKRLFKKESLTAKISAVLYSVFSTIGHLLIVILALLAVKIFLLQSDVPLADQELYSVIILYSFIFPLIFTSGLCITISRYLADMLWQDNAKDILASVYGAVAIYCLFASLPALLLLSYAKLDWLLSLFAYLLYMSVGIIYILMVYVSALKDYAQISKSFITGMIFTFAASYFTVKYQENLFGIATTLVGYFAIGMSIVASGIFLGIKKYYRKPSNRYFDWLLYLKKYPSLFLLNTFYMLGIYCQNFIFWAYPQTQNSVSVFIFSDDFDLATALGVLSILPAIVLFVVRMETSFYDYFRDYLQAVNTKTGAEINRSKKLMQRLMWQEFLFVAEIQILVSLVSVVLGMVLLPKVGISTKVIEIFPNMVAGFLFAYFMFLACTLMQYFENYSDCLKVMSMFFVMNAIFTNLSVLLGPVFYGTGILFASIASLIAALIYLKKTLDSVDYIIFCSANPEDDQKNDFFENIIDRMNGKWEEGSGKNDENHYQSVNQKENI